MTQKKICLLIPSLHPGGMERVMSELANHFVLHSELEVHLILYGLSPTIFYPLSEKVKVYQPDWIFDNKKRIWHTIRRMHYLRKTIKLISPNSVLSFGEYWNNFVLIALWGLNYPIFVSDRCQPDKSLGRLHDTLRRWLYPRAAGVVAQTSKAKEIYTKQNLNRNIEIIGNPIRQIKADLAVSREKIVLSVGRLIKTKHHDLLIDIFLQCNQPDWKLVIVGGNAIKQNGFEQLTQKVKELDAEDKVILAGNQSDVDSFYRKASIFAFTSSSEGFPNVIGEAMSAGVPVVAFDCIAGPSDMIADGENSFLVPLFDAQEFQYKLKDMMTDEQKRDKLSVNAKQSITEFEVDAISYKYYQYILNKR